MRQNKMNAVDHVDFKIPGLIWKLSRTPLLYVGDYKFQITTNFEKGGNLKWEWSLSDLELLYKSLMKCGEWRESGWFDVT